MRLGVLQIEKAFCEFVRPRKIEYPLHEIDDLNKLLITEEGLRNRIHNDYLVSESGKTNWMKKTINAYDLTGCIKKLYFSLLGVSKTDAPNYPYSNIVFGIGNSVHKILMETIKPEEQEVSFKSYIIGFELSTRCDAIYHGIVLHEYKTVDNIDEKTEIKKEHEQQASIYAYLLNKYHGRNIKYIQVVYVSRGKVNVKIFTLEMDKKRTDAVENMLHAYLRYLKDCLDTHKVPSWESEYCGKSYDCKYCEYASICQILSNG